MPTYEIKRVIGEPRAWNANQGGPMLAYTLDVEANGTMAMGVEWSRKKDSRPPEPGEELVAHLDPPNFEGGPERLKVDYQATKELRGGTNARDLGYKGPGKSRGQWQPESERDPERSARILRQHSQEMALRWVTFLAATGPASPDLDELFRVVDLFDQDVNRAGQAAKEGAGNASSGSAPAPPSQPAIDLQECAEALDTAGLMSGPAQNMVAEYMAFHLSSERCAKAVRQLTNAADLETQAMTLKALKANTEKHYKTPLPAHGDSPPDDDLPF